MRDHVTLLLAVVLPLVLPLLVNGAADWRTAAERSGFKTTSNYEDTVSFCKRLDEASPWIRYLTFGQSHNGRALPLLVLSRDGAFTPEAAHKTGKPIVLIQNGIHSGEIDGKEACFALAREIAITKTLEGLLDSAIVLVMPIYNVDGHEMASRYNRFNQKGPEEMGWRANAQNLNLNRDYLKADAPETRALLALWTRWRPDLFIDTHVTDGADFQYDVLYTMESTGYVAPEVARYVEEVFQPHVRPAMEREGHVVRPYFVLRTEKEPAKGLQGFIFSPRFSNGWAALWNRPAILVETHMLKSFEIRIKATYDLLVATLREVNRDPASLRNAVKAADEAAAAIGAGYEPERRLPLRLAISEKSRTERYRGVDSRIEQSDVSGSTRVVYGSTPLDVDVQVYDDIVPASTVSPPLAYVVPPAWTAAIERLRAHGLRLETLEKPVTAEFETYRLTQPKWFPQPFEGHHPVSYTSVPVRERRTLPAGSVVVRLNQAGAKLAVHLLEPDGPDSFVAWGFFDSSFEQKEYGEDYLVEDLAREMLAKDEVLRKEFEARLASDETFRNSPDARLAFFYDRSPYYDRRIGAYPVVRLVTPIALETSPLARE
jgi:hypothetical protein